MRFFSNASLFAITVTVSCFVNAQNPLSADELEKITKISHDLPPMKGTRLTKRQAMSVNPRFGGSSGAVSTLTSAANSMMAGMSRVVGTVPQFSIEGRHYWPTDFSLTRQFGLQGINELVGEVVAYERNQALRAAKEAACHQRDNCVWNQRLAFVTNIFRTPTEEQRLIRGIDCNVVFAGCEHFR